MSDLKQIDRLKEQLDETEKLLLMGRLAMEFAVKDFIAKNELCPEACKDLDDIIQIANGSGKLKVGKQAIKQALKILEN